MHYEGPADITNETIVLKINNFQNPVNKKTKLGFRMTTQDPLGYLIEQSHINLELATEMTISGELSYEDIQVLGDEYAEDVGRVSTYNKVALTIGS